MPSMPRQRSTIHPGHQPRSRVRPPRVPHPRVYDFVISRMRAADNSQRDIPARILLLRYRSGDPSSEQLFLDQMPVPREAWDYDVADRILSWRGAYGGGRLHMGHDGLRATGLIGLDSLGDSCSVQAGSTAIFDCSVALDTGALYKSDGGKITGLTWDPTSSAWQNATWKANENRLRLTYTFTPPSDPFGDPSFTFGFVDSVTGESWSADFPGNCLASLKLVTQNGQNVWSLAFSQGSPPGGSPAPSGPDSVFPFMMQAVEDVWATSITGVLVIDKPAPQGALVGLQGQAPSAAASGYYRTSPDAAPFGVFGGGMTIGGRAILPARLIGSVLHWEGLAPADQQRTGLPERGSVSLQADGATRSERLGVRVTRLGVAEALASIAQHHELHPDLHARVVSMQQALSDPAPDGPGLMGMNPFAQDAQGAWGDAVQAAVRQDLSVIMNSCIPSDLWNLLYPGHPQPPLTDYLAQVADSAVDGVPDPKSFYRSLATAVLTQGMANGSDAFCRNLNGPRAAAWLKTQLSTSPVYNAHGQKLFQHEWQNRFNATAAYLADQGPTSPNLTKYATQIDGQVQSAVTEINQKVTADASVKQDLIKQVQNAGNYATQNHLYWAFWFYLKNTTPGMLANIAIQMSFDTGSSDGTTLSRAMQQAAAVLTALDPSGFFARQYTDTLNTYLVTNILPSMFGFTKNSSDFDMVKKYLEAFRDTNLTNADQAIAAAAQQIADLLAAENADQMLHDSIEALRTAAELAEQVIALPIIADKFVDWFQQTYPKFASVGKVFGSLLIAGVTGLAIFNLISEFKDFDKLSPAQQDQLITNALQFGVEIVAAVVKRGVAIRDIMSLDGLTKYERAAAVGKALATGEAEGVLDDGLLKIGNAFGRWVSGTASVVEDEIDTAIRDTAYVFEGTAEEETSLLTEFLGDSMEEFVATRLGPLFILAGIGFSIYTLVEGEGDLQIANDVLNIVGGSLMVLAIVGEWAISYGLIAADGIMASIISFAGPLAILAGLAGLGLMIAEMFQKPPDPVEEFVNNYAAPAGFAVSSQSSSIDYAVAYENPDQDKLLMVGFSLSAKAKKYLLANDDGSIGVGDATFLPNCVWLAQTDGLGMSRIATLVRNQDATKPPIPVLLSLMQDSSGLYSISFQPKMPPPTSQSSAAMTEGAKVISQTWLSTPRSGAQLTSKDGYLAAIQSTLQPVLPDAKGNLAPSQASGWLVQTDQGASLSPTRTDGDTFTLRMSAMAPNYMRMADLYFILNSQPSTTQSYGPSFGMYPSTPMTYGLAGKNNVALPAFLSFSKQTGALTPNGSPASMSFSNDFSISAASKTGIGASAAFRITVADTPPTSSGGLMSPSSRQRVSRSVGVASEARLSSA